MLAVQLDGPRRRHVGAQFYYYTHGESLVNVRVVL